MFSAPYRLIPLLLLFATSLAAQGTLDSVSRNLKRGQLLRVRPQGGQRLEGRFADYTPIPPTLQLAIGDTTIPVTMIDSLWARGNAANTGAILGAVVLGVPSVILWKALCDQLNESTGRCESWGAVAAATAASAGVGALLGAAIGSASPRWRLRYARLTVGWRLIPLPERRVGAGVSIQFSARIP